jgi:hypothetical protein
MREHGRVTSSPNCTPQIPLIARHHLCSEPRRAFQSISAIRGPGRRLFLYQNTLIIRSPVDLGGGKGHAWLLLTTICADVSEQGSDPEFFHPNLLVETAPGGRSDLVEGTISLPLPWSDPFSMHCDTRLRAFSIWWLPSQRIS